MQVPASVARVAEIMSTFPAVWALCGGWGVDAWLGRQTRKHKDVDIAVFQEDLGALLDHFEGWQLHAHDETDPDSEAQWQGRILTLPAHVHVRHDDVNLDVQVSERDGDSLVLSRVPHVHVLVDRAIATSSYGVPTLCPEAILYYKALERRPQDDLDFAVLEPSLTSAQSAWLRDAIVAASAG